MRTSHPSFTTRAASAAVLGLAMLLPGACQSEQKPPALQPNPALRSIHGPTGGTSADADRAALARFVGAWTFEGWSTPGGGPRVSGAGRAAGTIENEHFVLLDFQATSGELAGKAGRKSGSMLLASEPGIGVTLTAWGDASPSVSRCVGRAEGGGSAFTFDESRTPAGIRRHSVTFTFLTDDRWTAQIWDGETTDRSLVASYTFSRVKS